MSILIGSNKANKMFWGSTPVKSVFWGANKVWPSTVPKYVITTGSYQRPFYVSTDLSTWTAAPALDSTTNGARGICYANGTFVCGSGNRSSGKYYYSKNGTDWTAGTFAPGGSYGRLLYRIIYINGVFVGREDNDNLGIYTSDNGLNWNYSFILSPSSSGTFDFATNGSLIVGVRSYEYSQTITTSTDGINWTNNKQSGKYLSAGAIDYGGGWFVTLPTLKDGTAYSWRTQDGATWTAGAALPSGPRSYAGKALAYGGGKFVGITADTNYVVYTSNNGASWSYTSATPSKTMNNIKYVNGTFVILCDGGYIRTSTDGVNWVTTQITTNNDKFYDIAYGEAEI